MKVSGKGCFWSWNSSKVDVCNDKCLKLESTAKVMINEDCLPFLMSQRCERETMMVRTRARRVFFFFFFLKKKKKKKSQS